jgi:cytochrome c oxidase subunit 3
MELLKRGILWFISSEIWFFISFFWAFFHFSLSPRLEIGRVWPPLNVEALGPFAVPLLNTVVLVSSGVSFTWSHHRILRGNLWEAKLRLLATILLGLYFTILQLFEYKTRVFGFNDSIYGRIFFLATGFHGCHVIIGTFLLRLCFYRLNINHFSSTHHVGLELRGWYWHFVDVVWLFLFCCVYWWGRR